MPVPAVVFSAATVRERVVEVAKLRGALRGEAVEQVRPRGVLSQLAVADQHLVGLDLAFPVIEERGHAGEEELLGLPAFGGGEPSFLEQRELGGIGVNEGAEYGLDDFGSDLRLIAGGLVSGVGGCYAEG